MGNYTSTMPLWGIILFIATFPIAIWLIADAAKKTAINSGMSKEKSRNIQLGIFCFFTLWLIYASVLSFSGILYINSLPPKVFLFTALPLILILTGIIGTTALFKKLLQHATLESIIRIHSFRFIGVFFIILYFNGLLPAKFAFIAGLGDIASALFALITAKYVEQKKPWSIKLAYSWNVFGTLDIISVITSAILTTRNAIATHETGVLEGTLFPFVWIPAFAPATILFLHISIFRKLRQITKR